MKLLTISTANKSVFSNLKSKGVLENEVGTLYYQLQSRDYRDGGRWMRVPLSMDCLWLRKKRKEF